MIEALPLVFLIFKPRNDGFPKQLKIDFNSFVGVLGWRLFDSNLA